MSSDRELLIDLLARAYSVLLKYGAHNSTNMDRVLLMDEIKLELEFGDRLTDQPDAAPCPFYGCDKTHLHMHNSMLTPHRPDAARCDHNWHPFAYRNRRPMKAQCTICGAIRDLITTDPTSEILSTTAKGG